VTGLTERSDRAWKLAILTEHLSVHDPGEMAAELALGHVGTGAAERARIRQCQRLLATCWLRMLLPCGLSHPAHSAKCGCSTTPTLAPRGLRADPVDLTRRATCSELRAPSRCRLQQTSRTAGQRAF
jgi:hypothetical protein